MIKSQFLQSWKQRKNHIESLKYDIGDVNINNDVDGKKEINRNKAAEPDRIVIEILSALDDFEINRFL